MDEPIESIEQLLSRPLQESIMILRHRSLPLSTLFSGIGASPNETRLTCPVCGETDLWPYDFHQRGEAEAVSFMGRCRHVVALVFVTTYPDTTTRTTPYLVREPDSLQEEEEADENL
jgi:hypothetical protein